MKAGAGQIIAAAGTKASHAEYLPVMAAMKARPRHDRKRDKSK
jgi:hypothetical protein